MPCQTGDPSHNSYPTRPNHAKRSWTITVVRAWTGCTNPSLDHGSYTYKGGTRENEKQPVQEFGEHFFLTGSASSPCLFSSSTSGFACSGLSCKPETLQFTRSTSGSVVPFYIFLIVVRYSKPIGVEYVREPLLSEAVPHRPLLHLRHRCGGLCPW